MKVIIPYRHKINSTELRYAIRSLCMHFTDMTGLTIVGKPPDWYIGDYINIPDIEGRKEYSIYNKLIKAGKGETVLFANDDHFALKPFGADLPNYYNGHCGDCATKSRIYRELYANCPAHWLNYDIHTPMVMNTSLFIPWFVDRPIKTQYMNLCGSGVDEQLQDCKIGGNPTYEECLQLIAGRPFFSTYDNSHHPGVLKLLQTLYPVASCYERD